MRVIPQCDVTIHVKFSAICRLYPRSSASFRSNSSQLSDADFETVDLTNVALELMSKFQNGSITSTDMSSVTTEITVTAAEIDITTAISKISDLLADNINTFIQTLPGVGYIKDDGQMLEATNKVLTSVCSDIIRAVVQSRIYHALMLDLREKAMSSYSFICEKLPDAVETNFGNTSESKFSNIVSPYSTRVVEETRDLHMRSVTSINARLISEHFRFNIIILDVDREVIVDIFIAWESWRNSTRIQSAML